MKKVIYVVALLAGTSLVICEPMEKKHSMSAAPVVAPVEPAVDEAGSQSSQDGGVLFAGDGPVRPAFADLRQPVV